MLDHRFYDQIIATQLAAGVTKTVLHGWASTAGAEETTAVAGPRGHVVDVLGAVRPAPARE